MTSPRSTPPLDGGSSTPIHLFVPKFRVEECLSEIKECLERGWTGLGYKTVDFETAWRDYTGLPHAHFVASATAGLHLAVALLKEAGGWSDGDEVISTPLTFVSTNHVILHSGLRPVFADVDETLCLDPESVLSRLGPRTRAVMFVGLGGNVGRLGRIVEICRERNLRLILDAAHMAGTRVRGTHVGAEADATVFSFQAVKNLPTADSGMVCFREGALDEAVRKWTWLGINKDTYSRTQSSGAYRWRYDVERVGFKYHGNSVMAALGLVGLKYLDEDNAYRRRLASKYDESLSGVSTVSPVKMAPECEPSRHLYQVLVDDRDAMMQFLNARKVYPGVHYTDNTDYPMYRSSQNACPKARHASDHLISLPLHTNLVEKEVDRVASLVGEFCAAKVDHA
jgi:dTDP-4-amino-4,6-dideoxygalactose transaminase